ncbi:predicted protein [Nematostella vectensis]|uniref:ATR-interacting protein n=1 Tax=Nematostella vectensis TaxID=45351 RepID=A7RP24_NEMVE|nr:predicted protein [Nematostella vectensis]|eukprot:XP_001638845.1 predicted protein [Nematostella vectensis]
MSNWGRNNGPRQQKKRTFIYNTPANHPPVANFVNNLPPQHSGLTSENDISSPRKKRKSSHGATNDRATENLLRDLPPEAFDDDLGDEFGIDDDDALCEVASLAELQTQQSVQTSAASVGVSGVGISNTTRRNRTSVTCGPDTDTGIEFSESLLDDCDELEMINAIDNVSGSVNQRSSCTFEKRSADQIKGNANSNARPLQKGIVLKPDATTNLLPSNQSEQSTNGKAIEAKEVFSDSRIQSLQKEIEELKEKYSKAQSNVQSLEEEKYGKDGELRMLKESLAHFQAEEAKKREQIRAMEDQRKQEQSEKEKELQKQVEHLTTRLKFQEQEIAQAMEQRKKHTSKNSADEICSPYREPSIAGNFQNTTPVRGIPMGSSFYEKEKRLTKVNTNEITTDNSENSYSETISKSFSGVFPVLEEMKEECVLSKSILRTDVSSKGVEVELLQKLFRAQNVELNRPDYSSDALTEEETLVSLLRPTAKPSTFDNTTKKSEELDVPPTLLLFETPLTSKTQSGSSFKDSKADQEDCVKLAFESLNELLNSEQVSLGKQNPSVFDIKDACARDETSAIHSAVGLLPVLESHIALYCDLRLDKDESLTSTYSGGVDMSDQQDACTPDREGAQALSEALNNCIKSLQCLNVLVLYSVNVCEMMLRSARTLKRGDRNEDNEKEKGKEGEMASLVERSVLLDLTYKLLTKQPNEPSTISHAALHVLASLAQKCPNKYQNRLFLLLTEGLLTQCLTKNPSFTMLSLVMSVLIPMAAFDSAVLPYLCPQSDECLLVKIYQGVLDDSCDILHSTKTTVQMQVVEFLNKLLSRHPEALSFLLDTECHCTMELTKSLVLMLYKEMVFLQKQDSSLILLDEGARLFLEHRLEVVQQFANLILGVSRLYHSLSGTISETEVMSLQDLAELDHSEDLEILQFGDEDDAENMDIDG